jgi:hypothetical protein
MLERLRCGVIVTAAFIEWMKAWKAREGAANFGLIAELSYVRCKEGERAGQSWVSLVWRPLDGIKEHELFEVGTVKLYFPKQTRLALRDRCLDIQSDRIVVI